MKESIGGYFSLELPLKEEYHKNAIRLNTGRNCLEYILRSRKYKKVYIPFYTCDAVLEPFKKLNVDYSFYHIDFNFEITDKIELIDNEALLYTNYFGLKQLYVKRLAELYGQQLIVDSTQAFYAKPLEGIDTFYTCRKFFGVPDGAYLYTDGVMDIDCDIDISYNRCNHLLKRIDISAEFGYDDYHNSEEELINCPIKKMSKLTRRIMQSIDYESVKQNRCNNFNTLNDYLSEKNYLHFNIHNDDVPMVYPFLSDISDLRKHLIHNRIYVAQYWPSINPNYYNFHVENKLALLMAPLPIDQRYGDKEMRLIINIICNLQNAC